MSTLVLRPRVVTLAAAALVVAVCALPSTPLVLPVVVGVAGWSAARLVLGAGWTSRSFAVLLRKCRHCANTSGLL